MCRPADVFAPHDAVAYPCNPPGDRGLNPLIQQSRKVMCVMNQDQSLSERLTRLKNICASMEEALGHARGIEDDYRRGSLEAHIRGALREINAQTAEVVSTLSTMHRNGHAASPRSNQHLAARVQETGLGTPPPRHN